MKFLAAIFFNVLFLVSVVSAQEPFRLSQMRMHTNLDSYMGVIVDTANAYIVKTIREKDFVPLQKINYGISKNVVWTRTEILNDTDSIQKIILFNPLASMDEIDVYIYQNGILSAEYALGDRRAVENNSLFYRLAGISLEIASG